MFTASSIGLHNKCWKFAFYSTLPDILLSDGPQQIKKQAAGREINDISLFNDSLPGNSPSIKTIPITEAE